MTIKVTIHHDEPTSTHSINVGVVKDMAEYPVPQIVETREVKPGESTSVHVHAGQRIEVWEAALPIELAVAEAIEREMYNSNTVPKPTLDPKRRILVARAAINAARDKHR